MKTFEAFGQAVRTLLDELASMKHYNITGPDGLNTLYEFVHITVGGPHHAIGEIIYKSRRYEATGNPQELLKIAAWAVLIWKHQDLDTYNTRLRPGEQCVLLNETPST